jgi:hypothetical protein
MAIPVPDDVRELLQAPRCVHLSTLRSGRTICQSALEPGSSFPFRSGPVKVPPVSGTMRGRPWAMSPDRLGARRAA